jgi:hypothetical protein
MSRVLPLALLAMLSSFLLAACGAGSTSDEAAAGSPGSASHTRLARHDALDEYISHTGSAVFACPPGAKTGGYVGSGLLA